jgi:hypothetical protein
VRLVLLPSPLLGPAVWASVAVRFRARGWQVHLPRLGSPVTTPDDVARGWLEQVPRHEPLVLVPHSNAGLYVAALAGQREATSMVFVDAGLPSTELVTPVAPAPFRDWLGSLVGENGLLPPWTQWWPPGDIEAVLPDPRLRSALAAEARRLPISYFDGTVSTPPGWESVPAAYVAFGDTYAEERAEAERRGWPVETMEGQHLHMMVDPGGVAAVVARLIDVLADG